MGSVKVYVLIFHEGFMVLCVNKLISIIFVPVHVFLVQEAPKAFGQSCIFFYPKMVGGCENIQTTRIYGA